MDLGGRGVQTVDAPWLGQTLPTKGRYDVSEYFGEVLIPVVKDVPFVKEFNVTLGGRVREVAFSVRLYSFTEIRMLLTLVGFEIAGLYAGYDVAAGTPTITSSRMLVLARKPLG